MKHIFLSLLGILLVIPLLSQPHIDAYRYWLDQDQPGNPVSISSSTSITPISAQVPVQSLDPGFHLLHFQARDNLGRWTSVESRSFYKLISGKNPILKYEYWFDEQSNNRFTETFQINPGMITVDELLPADGLPSGRHSFHIRFLQSTGEWSAVESYPFYHPGTGNQIAGYEYWFSGLSPISVDFSSPQSSMVLLERLFVQSPNSMQNTLFIRFRDIHGNWSAVYSQAFQNNGVSTPGLSGTIYDVGVDTWTQNFSHTPLAGVKLYLWQGTALLDSTISSANGTYSVSLPGNGEYRLQLQYEDNGTLFEHMERNLDYEHEQHFFLPIELNKQVKAQIPFLSELDLNISHFGEQHDIQGYELSQLESLLAETEMTEDEINQVTQTLGRLFLMEQSLQSYYMNSNLLLEERQLSIRDIALTAASLINVFNLISDKAYSSNSLTKEILQHTYGLVLRGIRVTTDFAFGLFAEEGQDTKSQIKQAIDYMTLALEGQVLEAEIMRIADRYVVEEGMKNQMRSAYLDRSQTSVDLTIADASTFPVENHFQSTYFETTAQLAQDQAYANAKYTEALVARNSAMAVSTVEDMFAIREDIAFHNKINILYMDKIKNLMKGIQFGSLTAGTSISHIAFVKNRKKAVSHTENILLRTSEDAPWGWYEQPELMSFQVGADSSLESWLANLRDISQSIASGQLQLAEQKIDLQIQLDESLNSHMDSLLFPLMSANEILGDSIPNFQEGFSAALGEPIRQFEWDRLLTFQVLLEYALDSAKVPYADSLNMLANQIEQQWLDLQPSLDSAFQQIAFVPSPAYIQPTLIDMPDSLQPGASYPCKVIFSNVGKIHANNLVVIIKAENGLSSSIETAMIQNMTPGSTDSLSFLLQAPNADMIGTYQLLFLSGNSASGGIGGAVKVGNPVFTSVNTEPIPWSQHSVYPNPFESITHLEFELSAVGEVLHSVYALSGQLMHWEKRMMSGTGQQQLIFDGSRLPTGMYLSRIQTRDKVFLARMLKK